MNTTTDTTHISWDDVKALIYSLAEQSKETDRRMKETDALIRELRDSSKETDALIRELRDSSKETDLRLKETDALIRELRDSGKETDQRMKETDLRMKETDRRMKQLQKQIGELGNRLGQFVQDMVQPAVVRLFQQQGIPVHRVYPNAVARDCHGQATMEIDLLVINGNHAIAVECKSRLTTSDVDEHIERLQRFKTCFDEYAGKALHGAVAAMGAPEEVIRYAERQGLYVLVQADDDIVLRNQPTFEPKTW